MAPSLGSPLEPHRLPSLGHHNLMNLMMSILTRICAAPWMHSAQPKKLLSRDEGDARDKASQGPDGASMTLAGASDGPPAGARVPRGTRDSGRACAGIARAHAPRRPSQNPVRNTDSRHIPLASILLIPSILAKHLFGIWPSRAWHDKNKEPKKRIQLLVFTRPRRRRSSLGPKCLAARRNAIPLLSV